MKKKPNEIVEAAVEEYSPPLNFSPFGIKTMGFAVAYATRAPWFGS